MKVLLSINPEFVQKIFCGEKRYEYRKTIFRSDVESILVYATRPIRKIVGELFIEEIIQDVPESIWLRTGHESGFSYESFKAYFWGRKNGYAIKIRRTLQYDVPIDPMDFNRSFRAPQSFCYVNCERKEWRNDSEKNPKGK